MKTLNTKRLTTLSLTLAASMILSYVEAMIPSIAIPGVKLGLANIAVVFALYALSGRDAAFVSLLRVILVSVLFGNAASFIYSAAGAVCSLCVMLVFRRLRVFSVVGVSTLGGVSHNIGQIIAAAVILGTDRIMLYLPVLLLSGVVSGIVVGILGGVVAARVKP